MGILEGESRSVKVLRGDYETGDLSDARILVTLKRHETTDDYETADLITEEGTLANLVTGQDYR